MTGDSLPRRSESAIVPYRTQTRAVRTETRVDMSDALSKMRRLVQMYPGQTWTLRELAEAAELTTTDAKIAAERLVIHGELVRSRRGEHYTRPGLEDEGLSAGSGEMG